MVESVGNSGKEVRVCIGKIISPPYLSAKKNCSFIKNELMSVLEELIQTFANTSVTKYGHPFLLKLLYFPLITYINIYTKCCISIYTHNLLF